MPDKAGPQGRREAAWLFPARARCYHFSAFWAPQGAFLMRQRPHLGNISGEAMHDIHGMEVNRPLTPAETCLQVLAPSLEDSTPGLPPRSGWLLAKKDPGRALLGVKPM